MTSATPQQVRCLGHASCGSEPWPASAPGSAQQYLAQSREYPHLQPNTAMAEAWPLMPSAQHQTAETAPLASELNSGVYKTDEFRMYSFKVRRCPKGPAHDWTACPYCHPGEKAKRRDPQKYAYTGITCPDFRKASCKRGDACPYAHGVFECWLHPSRYRTQLCKDGTKCTRDVCFFAHNLRELRTSSLSASLRQDWRPKSFGGGPPSPTAPPLLSSEEGSPRSLGAKPSPNDVELLQNLIPSPGSSYAGCSHLQQAPSSCSSSSLYSQAAETQSLLATGLTQQAQSQLHQQFPQHLLSPQMQQQPPQSQTHLQAFQEMEQAMRLLNLSSLNGYEGSAQKGFHNRAAGTQPSTQHLASVPQAMLHAPAHRRPTHYKSVHCSSPPPTPAPFLAMSSQYSPGRGSKSPMKPASTAERQWLEYLEASGHLPSHDQKPPGPRAPEPTWMEYAMLSRSLSQPPASPGFAQQFIPGPEACVSW
ncbi:hypothetical protein WJX74_008990 [Apatococcus lobatus]|uniref:C3H1-type domain-containing protein n=1 Tax=Apatococcus lobatus TaxID=904363 RepID=A0AAW1RBR9_9CHLO